MLQRLLPVLQMAEIVNTGQLKLLIVLYQNKNEVYAGEY